MNKHPLFKATWNHALEANRDHLEGPWYGVWRFSLMRILEQIHYNEDNPNLSVCTFLYGQDPVATFPKPSGNRPRDPFAPSPDSPALRKAREAAETRFTDVARDLFPMPPQAPRTPVRSSRKESSGGSRVRRDFRQPRFSNDFDDQDYVMSDSTNDGESVYDSDDEETRRTPDFSRITAFVDQSDSSYVAIRDLIVEIKRAYYLFSQKAFVDSYSKTMVQVSDQAYHAFKSSDRIAIIGCIIAIGQHWTYFEHVRENADNLKKVEGASITTLDIVIVSEFDCDCDCDCTYDRGQALTLHS
ncbi:hypothetical protein CVT26_010454 [Gymnopilus dilepis]|uniref:Uncharacterized protein n=1 Tax=Gymnopilus dilepis TaxID=231916 RepID=A0A409Y0I4_9AGAR|nr:hypothetical protein CVT26_010454 [Gymnopilus dilepis]